MVIDFYNPDTVSVNTLLKQGAKNHRIPVSILIVSVVVPPDLIEITAGTP